jgi:hypothetical protein
VAQSGEFLGDAGGCVDTTEQREQSERIRQDAERLDLTVRAASLITACRSAVDRSRSAAPMAPAAE